MPRSSFLRQVLLFALIRVVVHTGLRMVHPFLPAIGRGLGVNLASMALVVSISMLAGMIGPFFAPLADRLGRRVGMILGLIAYIAGMLLVVAIPSYSGFLIALLVAGAGSAVFVTATQAYTGDVVPYETRGRVMSLIEYSWGLSFIIGMPIVGLIIDRLGWRAPFPLFAALSLLGLLFIYFRVPDTRLSVSQTEKGSLWNGLRAALVFPPALFAVLMGLSSGAGNEIVVVVFGAWLEDVFALEVVTLGAVSVVIGLSEIGGETLAAWLVDRLGKEKSIALGLLVNSMTVVLLPVMSKTLLGGLVWLFIFFISFEFSMVSSLPLMSELYPHGRATLIGVYIASWTFGRALGALVGPLLYAHGFWLNVLVCSILDLLAVLALSRIRLQPVLRQSGVE